MTPTRYPGWRVLGFVLAVNNLLCILGAFLLAFNGSDTSLGSVGWLAKGTPPSDPKFLTFLFCMTLTVIGAALSARRPARGFFLLGSGYLASVASVAVLISWKPDYLAGYVLAGGVGLFYSWLGMKQLAADRG